MIACEDTHHTSVLLARHAITARLVSLHEHNERARARELGRAPARGGAVVALVSDAGTPLISDPGFALGASLLRAGVELRCAARAKRRPDRAGGVGVAEARAGASSAFCRGGAAASCSELVGGAVRDADRFRVTAALGQHALAALPAGSGAPPCPSAASSPSFTKKFAAAAAPPSRRALPRGSRARGGGAGRGSECEGRG